MRDSVLPHAPLKCGPPKISNVDHQWIKTMQPQNSPHKNVDYSGNPHKKNVDSLAKWRPF